MWIDEVWVIFFIKFVKISQGLLLNYFLEMTYRSEDVG